MSAIEQEGTLPVARTPSWLRPAVGLAEARRRPDQLVYGLSLAIGTLGMVVAMATLLVNETDAVMAPLLALVAIAQGVAVGVRRARTGVLDRPGVVLAVLALVAGLVVALLPTWTFGNNISGLVHRTVVSGVLLLLLAGGVTVLSIRRLFAASPSGQDLALAPVFIVAILLGLLGFVVVLARIIVSGASTFRFDMLTTAWGPIEGTTEYAIGYLNNILGTFLLLGLTLLFAFLPGVGAGVFMSEYPGRVARVISFSATMLRAMAIFIIGAAAVVVVQAAASGLDSETFLSQLIRGGFDDGTRIQAERGSFILAAAFLALLVMPVIARLTEEGLRSVPREMREGSVALGATDGYGLRRVLLPWAAPNIVTAMILAGAEAAGGLAVIWFIAGTGEHGLGPLAGVTDLDFAVFAATYGPREYAFNAVPEYQMFQFKDTAALLLLVLTMSLTVIAMLLRRRFAARYRGSLTV